MTKIKKWISFLEILNGSKETVWTLPELRIYKVGDYAIADKEFALKLLKYIESQQNANYPEQANTSEMLGDDVDHNELDQNEIDVI